MDRKDRWLSTLLLLFTASFFISFLVPLKFFILGLLVLYTLFHNSWSEKLTLLKDRKYLWFMLAFFAFIILSLLLSTNREAGLRSLQLRLPLLLFPLSLGLVKLSKPGKDKILLGIAIIVTVSCLASLRWAIHQYLQKDDSAWLYNDALSLLIGQQSIYTSVFVNISIYFFAYHLLYLRYRLVYRLLMTFAILFLFVTSYLLASRNMMLLLYLSVIVFSLFYILSKKKYLLGFATLLILLAGAFSFFYFFPKTINRFRELAFTQFDYKSEGAESHYAGELTAHQWNGANFRLAAWQCGWELFKEHPVTGVGIGDKKDELFRVYREKQFQFAIKTRKNVHNNYLDILYSMGFVSLLLFLAGWIFLPASRFIRNRDGLAILTILTLAFAMITENYFDRSIGAMLFPFLVCLFCSFQNQQASTTRQ